MLPIIGDQPHMLLCGNVGTVLHGELTVTFDQSNASNQKEEATNVMELIPGNFLMRFNYSV